jgi:DNA polymerase
VSQVNGRQARPNDPTAQPSRVYGGLMVENATQATARDVFVHGILALENAGYRVLFHVHDEVIVEASEDADPADVVRLLTQMPEWAAGLPVAAEAEKSTHYKK